METTATGPDPRLAPPAARPDPGGGLSYPDITVGIIPGFRPLQLDLRVPAGEGPFPVVLNIHGGGWREGCRRWLPETIAAAGFHERLLNRGYAVADVDYRLTREALFPAQLHDVKAAVRWLRAHAPQLRLDPARFAALGESAGGHLAAMAGLTGDTGFRLEGRVGTADASSAVQAVVDWYGVSDLLAFGPGADDPDGPAAWLLGGRVSDRRSEAISASPMTYVHAAAPPFLCVHGTDDGTVPYAQSEALTEALRGQGVRADLRPVPGADHIFLGAPDVGGLIEASIDFLDEVLVTPPPR